MEDILQRNHPYARLTTIRCGGPAEYLARPRTEAELPAVLSWAKTEGLEVFLLGNGSNIVVSDEGVPGVSFSLVPHLRAHRWDGDRLRVQGGALWPTLARELAKGGWRGLEIGIGIPGSIGGSVCMNAGVPERLISDDLVEVRVIRTGDGKAFTLKKAELEFGDRSSLILAAHDLVVVEATFRMYREEPKRLMEQMMAHFAERKARQPYTLPSAGCIFRRENGLLPGKMIEEAGCKGMREGGGEVSTLHANFIVNRGDATAHDIWALKNRVVEQVRAHSGSTLTTEAQFIGAF